MSARGADTAAATPIDEDAFDRRMAALGPFEQAPNIAVAVSGGPDSLCLALLLHRWTSKNGGRTIALIVDHGLRPESRDEARAVEHQLMALGLPAYVLTWIGPKPRNNIQAAARRARYDLLLDWCRAHGVIQLALGHHAVDQAETHLLRRRAGSGTAGLAGISRVSDRDGVRVIRPLLSLHPGRLRATLAADGVNWIEDPSNRDPKYARTALRREILAAGSVSRLCTQANRYAKARRTADHRIAELLAKSAKLFPTGHASIHAPSFATMDAGDGRRCLASIISCVGNLDYPPRTARLEAWRVDIIGKGLNGARTLGGCLIWQETPAAILVCREASAADEILSVEAGLDRMWDGRFKIRIGGTRASASPLTIRRLDDDAWGVLRRRHPDAATALMENPGDGRLPAPVRAALPMLCDLDGPLALPHLPKQSVRPPNGHFSLRISFQPHRSLAGPSFVANGG